MRIVLACWSTASSCAACLVLARRPAVSEIVTVEGLAPDGALTDVQQAFVDAARCSAASAPRA